MKKRVILAAIAALALASLACGITFNLPKTDVKTGPLVTKEINAPSPEGASQTTDLTLSFAAGELRLEPGAQGALVTGVATYNVADLEPKVSVEENRVSIETGDLEISGIPDFNDDLRNEWALKLGETPIRLSIKAGAYKGAYELGGLRLESLEVDDGAADVRLSFSSPNLSAMESLDYTTGASKVVITGLANANFEQFHFKSGAGDYTLDFSGELQRDATVTIDSGMSNFRLIVPVGVNARLFFDGGLANIDLGGAWEKSGENTYLLAGEGPTLTINVNLAAGNLVLSN
ncbi:MAG: toast rack family protein [Anaerolineales bacterium]|nr:toast rack family protein [Anaerolineales bacterium]